MKKLLLFVTLIGGLFAAYSAVHQSQQFVGSPTQTVNGANTWDTFYNLSVTTYVGTTNFTNLYNYAYATNVVVTNILANGTNALALTTNSWYWVYPSSTNTATGALRPFFTKDVSAWADANGNVATPSISATYVATSTATNTLQFNFVRSSDGVNYDIASGGSTFTFTVTPTTTIATTVTNVPSNFLTGTKSIRLYSTVSGTNTSAGAYTVLNLALTGYVP